MIRVECQPEPPDFNAKVREPGRNFLLTCPKPTQKQWKTHSYWRRILPTLHAEYRGVCSYSCHWIPFDTGADTVEHFKPKSKHSKEAYEWANYRLVCQLLNSRKKDEEDIIDPFEVETGWFVIEFPSLMVKPALGLNEQVHGRVVKTREVLGLNDDDTCMMMRQQFVTDYCLGEITFAHLEKRAPFLAQQMKNQGVDELAAIQKIMGIYPPSN